MAEQTFKILSDQGWHITKEGYDLITENGSKNDVKIVTQLLLDADIKEYGDSVLTTALNNPEISKVVLQIQKIRNISAPKSNQDSQAAPRMLKLILTDGQNHCQAVEVADLPFLNHNKTAPGSKLLIKRAVINSGYIFLDENSCMLLGGKVQSLYEKWEINRIVSKHNRLSYDGEGPPPWVSFGKKIQSSINNQPFKSLDNKQKAKENSEFDAQRQDAIAEASSGAIKKVFGGGVKQMQNANVIKERKPQNPREKFSERKAKKEVKSEEKLQKPPEKVSLFDFLENKLPANEELPVNSAMTKKTSEYTESKSNNYRNNFTYEKPKYNQPRNTYPNQGNNWHQQNNYNNPYQGYNANNNYNNYQQSRRNQYSYNNSQPNYYGNQRNTQNNKFDDKKLSLLTENFNQITINNADSMQKSNQHDKPHNLPVNKSTNEKPVERNKNLNSEFASRSFRMHLNIKPESPRRSNSETIPMRETRTTETNETNGQTSTPSNQINWKIGDQCMAKYWEDNKFYRATITDLTNRTCVVQFNDYGNFEEVLHCDCLPVQNEQQGFNKRQSTSTMEFRRGGNGFYNNKFLGKPKQ